MSTVTRSIYLPIYRSSIGRYVDRYVGRYVDRYIGRGVHKIHMVHIYLFYFIYYYYIYLYYFILFTHEAARPRNGAGSKMEWVVLCNFYFCCAFIFGQPMKKFEFFGASRATRQRHFKPEDEWLWGREWEMTGCDSCHHMRCHSVLCSPVFSVPPNTGH